MTTTTAAATTTTAAATTTSAAATTTSAAATSSRGASAFAPDSAASASASAGELCPRPDPAAQAAGGSHAAKGIGGTELAQGGPAPSQGSASRVLVELKTCLTRIVTRDGLRIRFDKDGRGQPDAGSGPAIPADCPVAGDAAVPDASAARTSNDLARTAAASASVRPTERLGGAESGEPLPASCNSEAASVSRVPLSNVDEDLSWPLTVALSNGREYGADLVVFATGVAPTGWELLPHDSVVQWQPQSQQSQPGADINTACADAARAERGGTHASASVGGAGTGSADSTTTSNSDSSLCSVLPVSRVSSSSGPQISGPSEMEALLQRLTQEQEAFLAKLLIDSSTSTGASSSSSASSGSASQPFILGPDGGLLVNSRMQTTGSPLIYAAGDAATVLWPQLARRRSMRSGRPADLALSVAPASAVCHGEDPPLWFQMRLWNQARTQAIRAARAMTGMLDPLEAEDGGPAFDMFAHTTRFCGFRVTLLGLFNGQGLLHGTAAAAARNLLIAEDSSGHGDARISSVGAKANATAKAKVMAGLGTDALDAAGCNASTSTSTSTTLSTAIGAATGEESDALADARVARARGGHPHPAGTRSPVQMQVQVQVRVTPGREYAKVVLLGRRVVGAMLIGDAADSIAETLENLILNRLPLAATATARARASATAGGTAGAHDSDVDGGGDGEDGGLDLDVMDLLGNDHLDDVFD